MIYFSPLRTKRLDVDLRELTIREAVDLAAVPPDSHEAAVTSLLKRIVKEARGTRKHPGRWTVQERMLAVAHYIACTSEGEGNFEIGQGRFLDYMHEDVDAAPEVVDVGQACGDQWTARQITGDEAAVMEGLCKSRLDWFAADMAARLTLAGKDEGRPDATARPGEFAGWLSERITVFEAMPESDFEDLFRAYRVGLEKLHHLFRLELDETGYVAMPRKGGGADSVPARFQVASALSALALELGARPDGPGDVHGPAHGDTVSAGA